MTMPLLRLELEGMRYQVMHALAVHQKEIEESVEAVLKREIEAFDFEAIIRCEVQRAFSKALTDAIQHHVWETLMEPEIQERIRSGTARNVADAVRKAMEQNEP